MGTSSALAATLCILALQTALATGAAKRTDHSPTLHITHYTHETRGGSDPTLHIAAGTNSENVTAGVGFGTFVVFDNPITQGPSNASTVLGRAAGVAVGILKSSPDGHTRVQMQLEHIFDSDGSTITVLGVFYSFKGPWEVTVAGGSGRFKGFRGYGVSALVSETARPPPVFLVYKWDFYLSK